MNKTKKIILIGIVVVVLAGLCNFYVNKWMETKAKKIELGLAESKFPYRDYTQEELNKMYPQIKYADVPTRITPEQTYAKFRQALKENNLEMALEQLSGESRGYGESVNTLTNFYNKNKFQELYKHYPEKIKESMLAESIAQYEYDYYSPEYKQELVGSIDFLKDANGDWKLDSL